MQRLLRITLPEFGPDFEDQIDDECITLASSASSDEESNTGIIEEIPINANNDEEMEIEEISEPVSKDLFKNNLKKFLEDDDEDCLLEDKTIKKLKITKTKAVSKTSSKNQSNLNGFVIKKNI